MVDDWKSDPIASDYEPLVADRVIHILNSVSSGRFFQIAFVVWKIISFSWVQSQSSPNPSLTCKRKVLACQLREALIALGVTFIKLGQFLSLRHDILPFELTDELSLLQDQVPPFSFEQVQIIMQQELGMELDEIFQSFESKPMASASMGQVHRATLRDGRAVAVKVQRPDISASIYQDLGVMRLVVRLAKVLQPKRDWHSWLDLVDEFGRNLFIEMNFLQEGRNADQIRQIVRGFPFIIIPRILWRYSAKRVITEQLCEGTKIDNLPVLFERRFDLKRLAKQLVEAYLEQVLIHGCFHADPHAGNFSISETGEIIIYDFGIIGYITELQRRGLCKAIWGAGMADVNVIIEALEMVGIIQVNNINMDRAVLQKIIQPLLDWSQHSSIEELDLSQLEKQIDMLLVSQSLKLPVNLAYLIRTAVALESVVHKLNPEFNLVRAAKPYLNRVNCA